MRVAVISVLILTMVGFARGGGASSDWSVVIRDVASPAGAESGQPQLTASRGAAILSWIERHGAGATLKIAQRTAGGWSEARVVAAGNDWFVNWADVPSVIRLDEGTLAAHWLQKSGADTYAYDVRLSFSKDDGRTWSSPGCAISSIPPFPSMAPPGRMSAPLLSRMVLW